MMSLQSVSFGFGDRSVLRECSLFVETGEIVALLGVNGAGKSTLMRLLAGLLAPEAGIVRIDGLDPIQQAQRVAKIVGYIPEGNPLYDHMTIGEYVMSMERLMQPGRAAARGREVTVARALHACDLLQRVDDAIGTLSQGWRQRVGLAVALLGSPTALVLDEPFSGLDPQQAEGLRGVIRQASRHAAVMISTHLISDIEELYTRVVVLHEGTIVEDIPVSAWSARKQDVKEIFARA